MEIKLFLDFISDSVDKISLDVNKLCSIRNSITLNDLRNEVMILDKYIKYYKESGDLKVSESVIIPQNVHVLQAVQENIGTKIFTLEELSRYNGINGNPAYIAVNGDVYDVTNNAGWAAARHFDLSAGSDVTAAYAACHSGSDVLSLLPIVGKLK